MLDKVQLLGAQSDHHVDSFEAAFYFTIQSDLADCTTIVDQFSVQTYRACK